MADVNQKQIGSLEDSRRYLRRYHKLKSNRSSYTPHWQELADFILPRRGRFETADWIRAGTKKNSNIINSTPTRALRIMSSGMMAGMTSPARPWFKLTTPYPELNTIKAVKQWLDLTVRRMLEVYARSNVYNALPMAYTDLGWAGTSSMFIEEHVDDVMRCHVIPVGSFSLAQDQNNVVNAIYRETTMTVEQMVRRFGKENCSQHVQTLYDKGSYDEVQGILHVVEPNDKIMHGRMGRDGMPWRSVWVESGFSKSSNADPAMSENRILAFGGFNEFPSPSPRWSVTGSDVYGNGPGMDALGDIKALQHMERKKARALDKIVDPPMQGPPGLQNMRTSLLPGDVTYVPTQGPNKFEPAHLVDSRVTLLGEELNRHEQRISQTFYTDLFLMLANSGIPNMTAREVEERHEEKMLQLGPALERLQDELLDPFIDRSFGIMLRAGLIPPIPEQMQGVDLRVEYVSILAQAQKLISTVAVERLGQFTISLSERVPEVLDKVEWEKMVDEYGDLLGVSPTLIRSDEEVRMMREERQREAREQATAVEEAGAMKDAAQAAKAASETQLGDQNALEALMGAYGAGVEGVAEEEQVA